MKKQYKVLGIIAYSYILLPFLIFFLGWIKLYIALPVVLILCYCFFKVCMEIPEFWVPEWNRENITKVIFIIGIIAIILELGNLYFKITTIRLETVSLIYW